MMRRQSNRLKTKKKQSSTPSNDFANAFNDIPVLFVQRARESSAPLPPPPPPPPRRCIIPGMCAGCKKPVSNIHTCDVCGHNMHVFCGLPIGEEGYGQKIRCVACQQALGDWDWDHEITRFFKTNGDHEITRFFKTNAMETMQTGFLKTHLHNKVHEIRIVISL